MKPPDDSPAIQTADRASLDKLAQEALTAGRVVKQVDGDKLLLLVTVYRDDNGRAVVDSSATIPHVDAARCLRMVADRWDPQ